MAPRLRFAWGPEVLRWNTVGLAVFVGVVIVVFAWFLGPGLFGGVEREEGVSVRATVTSPVRCAAAGSGSGETVHFEYGGKSRNGTLDACGHSQDEQVRVLVPTDAGSGLIKVSSADVVLGNPGPLRPLGLILLALSCASGAFFSSLLSRTSRRVVPDSDR